MNWTYTNIQHGPRIELGISPNEYCVLDVYYQTQASPKYSVNGWSENSYQQISDFLGFSKGAVHKMVDRFVIAGLMEVNPANAKQKRTTEAWYATAYERVQKVNESEMPVQKVNAAVQKVNASRSKSERHIEEREYKRELKESTPAIAAPSILKSVQSEPDETVEDSAADFISRHSAPRNEFSPFTAAPLPAFQGGTEEDYQSIYSRIADSLNNGNNWASIAALAKCTMTGAQFKDELQTWIRYYMSKPHLYNKPVQSLRGGPISFVNWLSKPWAQEKYNPQVKAKQIQEQRRSPVRRQISTLA